MRGPVGVCSPCRRDPRREGSCRLASTLDHFLSYELPDERYAEDHLWLAQVRDQVHFAVVSKPQLGQQTAT